jgi:hypothetical protein
VSKPETEASPVADACPKKEIHNKKISASRCGKKMTQVLRANRASGDSIRSPWIARVMYDRLHTHSAIAQK